MKMRPLPLGALVAVAVAVALVALWWWQERPASPIPVAIVAKLTSGAVVGSSEMNAAEQFLEERPQSRIRIVRVYEECHRLEETAQLIAQAMDRGVRFFITTHPSKCAVASAYLFAGSRALVVNAASTSPALTGKDDFLLRIIPDAVQEQRAIARYVNRMPGHRILILQDEGNRPYTDPAFAAFSAELATSGQWSVVHRTLTVAEFKPADLRSLMAEPFDALYILAGTFQTAIANIAQLFHYAHPEAPILLTPWARSPDILESAGEAIDRIVMPSPYASRRQDPALESFLRGFRSRFGYEPHAQIIGVRQALELLDQAFAKGYDTPERVKDYLLSAPRHQTSLGPIAFDRYGDVSGDYHFIRDLRQELQ